MIWNILYLHPIRFCEIGWKVFWDKSRPPIPSWLYWRCNDGVTAPSAQMWGLWGATGGAASASSHPVPSPVLRTVASVLYRTVLYCAVLCYTVVTTTSQYISHGCVAAPPPGLLLIKLCWHWRMERWVSLVRAGTLVTRTCRSEDTGTPHLKIQSTNLQWMETGDWMVPTVSTRWADQVFSHPLCHGDLYFQWKSGSLSQDNRNIYTDGEEVQLAFIIVPRTEYDLDLLPLSNTCFPGRCP